MGRPYQRSYGYGGASGGTGGLMNLFGPLTQTVKYLIIANAAMFFLAALIGHYTRNFSDPQDLTTRLLALYPEKVFPGAQVWRLFTYLFLHGDLNHILMNMLTLWWFGSPLEMIWGRRKFLTYYFACGIGAGIACVPYYLLLGQVGIPVVGASGAIFGLLVAFALIYPNARVYLMFLIPLKAKWLVAGWMVLEIMATTRYAGGSGVASIAHVAGGIIGYFYLRRFMDLKYYWLRFRTRKTKRPFRVINGGREEDKDERGPWLH
jgi:membrane associated rhomboid family serine protease